MEACAVLKTEVIHQYEVATCQIRTAQGQNLRISIPKHPKQHVWNFATGQDPRLSRKYLSHGTHDQASDLPHFGHTFTTLASSRHAQPKGPMHSLKEPTLPL